MNYYMAPLEGITGYIYRNAYHAYFTPLNKYFTPFLVPNQNHRFKSGEINDILPEHNQGLCVVPQLLTNKAEDFLWAAGELHQYGYHEINLNLGCPSKTVVTKGKGSGFLAYPEKLDRFLEDVFTKTPTAISIKTRLGKTDPEDFFELLEIYNKYPLTELIIHPRIQTDYYKNNPNMEIFTYALENSRNPVIYNGDLNTVADLQHFCANYPSVNTVMIGRGLLRNPDLIGSDLSAPCLTKDSLQKFHNQIYTDYQTVLHGERNVLFKMKEIWLYLSNLFPNGSSWYKKIKKTEKLAAYDQIISQIFQEILL